MRDDVLDAALARRQGAADPVVDVYVSLSERLEQAIVDLPDDALDVVTPNGLTAHDLVVHMAAQESLLAQNLGAPTIEALDEEDIVARTARAAAPLRRSRSRRRGDLVARFGGGEPSVGRRQSRSHRDLAWPRADPRRHAAGAVVRGVGAHRRPARRSGTARRRAGDSSPGPDVRPRPPHPAAWRWRWPGASTTGRPHGWCSPALAAVTRWCRWGRARPRTRPM